MEEMQVDNSKKYTNIYKNNLKKFEQDVIELYKKYNYNIFVKDMIPLLGLWNDDIKFLPSIQDILNKIDFENSVVNLYTCKLNNELLINEIEKYSKDLQNKKLFNKLNYLCYKIHNKRLIRYCVEDLNWNWKKITNTLPEYYYKTYEHLKNDLFELKEELGYLPSVRIISEKLGIGYRTLEKFGGMLKIKQDLGCTLLIDNRGYLNRSEGELAIAQFLIHNNIKYERDVYISDNFKEDGYFNCDFVVENDDGKKYWIEFWGMCGMFNYEEKIKTKIKLYQKFKHNLISISFKDYYKNSYENFIKILEKKLSFIKNIKKLDKQDIFLNYKIMSDRELYEKCLDNNGEKILIENLSNPLKVEIYKRFNSYLDLFEIFEDKIYNNSKNYKEIGFDNIFIALILKNGKIPSVKELNKTHKGLTRTLSRNEGKVYWEIKSYIKMINNNIKIPNEELKKIYNYIIKNKVSNGMGMNISTQTLIKDNIEILKGVI